MKSEDPQLWERVEAGQGQVLCRPGDRTDSLYLIRSGRVELTESGSTRVLGPGEFFGELDFTQPGSSQLTVCAIEDTALLRIDGKGLEKQLREGRGGAELRLRKLLGCGDQLIFLC